MKKSQFVILSLLTLFILSFTGCKGDKEEKIIGTWQRTVNDLGSKFIETYTFDANKNITIKLAPTSNNYYGYKVTGTWDIDFMGRLKMKIDENSLEPVFFLYNPDAKGVKKYLAKMKKDIIRQNEEMDDGAGIKIDFKDDKMVLTTLSGKQEYTRVENDRTNEESGD